MEVNLSRVFQKQKRKKKHEEIEFPYITYTYAGFDLTTHDSYFAILVEVLTNHILAENTYFLNCMK